jgi:murein DD-endopeptidase MepM/ murein hydrolase activator NlpD
MAIITVAQARQYAAAAGFSGAGLNTIVAIAQAESSLDTSARNINTDGSIDRGILQINKKWHPEVSDAQAYDPAAAFAAGYQISSRGSDFHPWSTYTNGAYKAYLSGVTGGRATKQWFNAPVTHGYIPYYNASIPDTPHYALDFGTDVGTPFFFLEPGTIRVADYATWDGKAGGGEVFLVPDDGSAQEYGFHLDQVTAKVGQHVKAGDLVGYTGGQNFGGQHPTDPAWSTGPHLHFGLFSGYANTPVGQRPAGPDPTPLIQLALAGKIDIGTGGSATDPYTGATPGDTPPEPGATDQESISERVHHLVTNFPGFAGMALSLDESEYFPGLIWYPTTGVDPAGYVANAIRSVADTVISNILPGIVRATFILIGLLLAIGLLYKLVDVSLGDVAESPAGQAAVKAAVAA